MKALFVFVALSVILIPRFLFSQNEIKNYEPPAVLKGTNLALSFNTSFSSVKESINLNKSTSGELDFTGNYVNWKLADKLNYVIDASADVNYHQSNTTEKTESDIITSKHSQLNLNAGISYYFLKNKIYGGAFIKSLGSFQNNVRPFFSSDIFPSIGCGKLVNAAELTDESNFEKVLLQEKLITKPLNQLVRKKLTELLDRRNNSEFTSKYHDDADIEFYAHVENLLIDEGIINGPLSSRTVLKLFQTLSNSKFVFYPRYKGYQFQAELDYNENNNRLVDTIPVSYLKSATFSAIYGLPLNMKLSLLGSAFLTIPVHYDYLDYYNQYTFNSPVTLYQYFQIPNYKYNLKPSYFGYAAEERYSFQASGVLDAFYNISSLAGANFHSQLNVAKIINEANDLAASFEFGATFNYNILSKMYLSFTTNFERSFYSGYELNGSLRIYYNIF